MTSVGLRTIGAALGLVLVTTRLAAQTLPVPALPPEPAPEPTSPGPQTGPPAGQEVVEAPSQARPRAWEYALGAGLGWDSNIDFLVPDGPSGVAMIPQGGLARVFSSPRAQLRATVAGRWTGYADHSDLRRSYADFGLNGGYQPSPGTQWHGTVSYGVGYSDSSRILLEQGVILPVVKTRSLAAALGLSRKVGRWTSLRLDGRLYHTRFDSPGLIDGESLRGTVGLDRQLGSRGTAALVYSPEYVGSDQAGRSYLTHFGSLQWTRVLSPRSAVLLEAGASYTPDAARAGLERKESFFGGASLSRQVRRSGLTLFVRREVTPAFGIGVSRLDLRTGLSATVPMGRDWELRMLANHVRPEHGRGTQRVHPSSHEAFAALGRRLGRQIEVSAQARYRRRGATSAAPDMDALQAGLFVTLLTPSGRAIAPVPGR